MMFKIIVGFLLIIVVAGCKNPVSTSPQSNSIVADSIDKSSPKIGVDIHKFPEGFFEENEIDNWDSFISFQGAIEDLAKLNTEGVGVFLEGILINTKELQNGIIPKAFDFPQIKSRIKLVQMQTMKSIYFTEYYTKDSLNLSLNKLYDSYNILLDRMISLAEEEDIFSSTSSEVGLKIKPE